MKKNTRLLLVVAILFCSNVTKAQTGDTLELKRNEKGVIEFACLIPNDTRKLINGSSFLKSILKVNPDDDFELIKETTDKYGVTHRRFQQYYKELKVDGAQYFLHGKNGIIEVINGNFQEITEPSVPALIETEALKKALSFVNARKYKWENKDLENWVKLNTNNPLASYYPKGELLMAKDYLRTKKFRLAWMFTISSLLPDKEQLIYVDAISGEIINNRSLTENSNTPLTAGTTFSGTQTITGDSFGGGYRLRESRNGVTIKTLDLQGAYTTSNAVDFVNNSTTWTTGNWANIGTDREALDAHWAAEKVLDYLSTVHGRNSLDGSGIQILSYINYGSNLDHASWISGTNNRYAVYGAGNSFPPLTTLDLCAHELAHGLNEFTANLGQGVNGTSEASALNEGLSDIWAACIEYYTTPTKQTWLFGEELFTTSFTCIRDLQNPNSSTAFEGQHPDTYQGNYWDNGGHSHTNSTVISHWFYLLSQGGSGTNDISNTYNVVGIGIDDAAAIVYQAETHYITSTATYANARTAMIQAARDVFGTGSCEEITVTNAWYAVGVGGAYAGNAGLSISGDNSFCTTSNNYTIPNLPTGATVQWQVSPQGTATPNTPSSQQTTLTKNSIGVITLTAVISNVCGAQITISKENISVGAPVTIQTTNQGCGGVYQTWLLSATPATNGTNWNWSVSYLGNNSQITIYTPSSPSTQVSVKGGGAVNLNFTNACGVAQQYGVTVYSSCGYGGYSYKVSASPNPAKNNLNISFTPITGINSSLADTTNTAPLHPIESKGKTIMSLYEINTSLLIKQWKENESVNSNYNLNISGLRKGLYILQVDRENKTKTIKIIIE